MGRFAYNDGGEPPPKKFGRTLKDQMGSRNVLQSLVRRSTPTKKNQPWRVKKGGGGGGEAKPS